MVVDPTGKGSAEPERSVWAPPLDGATGDESTEAFLRIGQPPALRPPLAGTPPAPATRAWLIVAAVGLVALVVAVALVLPGAGGTQASAMLAGAHQATPSSSDGEPPGGKYRVPGDLCQEADFTRLRPTFDTLGDLRSDWDASAGFFTLAQCDGSAGTPTVQGSFSFQAAVYANADVNRIEFDQNRARTQSRAAIANVAQLGQAAYSYVEPGVGLTVVTYDANLTLKLTWQPSDQKAATPAGAAGALADACNSTMLLLRIS
jgi:hypothetical protein